MSGIMGIYYPDHRPVDPKDVERMVDALVHRGSDGADIWVNGSIVMRNCQGKTSTTLWAILPLIFLLSGCAKQAFTEAQAFTGEYYVNIKGSDKGNGTKSSPWRSVQKALSSVPPNKGYTIHVGPGTFDVGEKASLPSGVNVIGSGVGSTTIMGEVQLVKVNNLTIRDINFNGKNYNYKLGMSIRDANELRLHNLAFNAYANQAINIERVSHGKIYNISIKDSSYNKRIEGGGGSQSYTVALGNLTNFDFYNVKIDTRSRGGAGIGSFSDTWPNEKQWEGPLSVLKNVKFYNLDIQVDKWNAWGNGWTPQMALELWHQKCLDCEINNSTFNSTLSLVTDNSTRIHVHHNLWYGPDNPFYACEANSDNIEFDHNYIRGGSYPIAMFGSGRNNLSVHHNIFEKTGAPVLVGNFRGQMNNFKFVNNTVYMNSATRLFSFEKGEAANEQIRNNIFYSSTGKLGDLLGASVGVDHNLFFNIQPVGSGAMAFDPKLILSGSLPSPYYKPKSGSRAVNLGAILAGSPAWNPGNN